MTTRSPRVDLNEQLLKTAIDLLVLDGEQFASALLLSCNVDYARFDSWYNSRIEEEVTLMTVTLSGPPGVYRVLRGLKGLSGTAFAKHQSDDEWAEEESSRAQSARVIRDALDVALDSVLNSSLAAVWVRLDSSSPYEGWREEYQAELRGDRVPANQAVVASHAPAFSWNGLRFRSKTEMILAQALSEKGTLFFPLPAAVSGRRKLEPDFLICTEHGKWGILEVNGDEFHPPQTAARDHERARWFKELGVRFYDIYSASDCYRDPNGVIDRFLRLLEAS
jgi:hypothetical protein